jgi:hypothetical protein
VEVLGDARRAVDLICPEEVARVSRMRSQPVATASSTRDTAMS